ncbi:MAG: DUF4097 domain-containing protein, partial [Oscillospiraceae bacterium]|nr:DUF4097 domain-containing protein [Oscillospiraceae bacterium]
KLLITVIILFVVGIIGVAVLAVNGYEDVFSLPVRYNSHSTAVTEVADSGYYYDSDGEFSILDMKYADTVTKLDINVKTGNFFIMSGDTLSISGSNIKTEYLDYKIEDGVFYVSYSPEFYLMNWDFNFDDAQIIITVPPKVYETANFSVKAGELHVGDFEVNRLYVDFAAGNSSFSNVSASEAAQIKMTAGDCVFENCSFRNADIKMTAGSMYYNACKIIGQNAINMTAGDLYMELLGKRSDYNISIDRTAGGVYIDGDYIVKEYAETTFATTYIIDEIDSEEYAEREVSVQEKAEENVKNDLYIKITAGECNITFYEN